MTQFYLLLSDGGIFGTKWAYGEVAEPVLIGNAQVCPVCGTPISMLKWMPPHYIKLSSSKPERWGDLLWGAGFSLMVSAKFRSVYAENGLTGISNYDPPATVVKIGRLTPGMFPGQLPEYSQVEIVWNGANLDDEKSRVVRGSTVCEFHRDGIREMDQIVLEAQTWIGVDVFVARGLSGKIIVSDRFLEVFHGNELKNAQFIPIEKASYDIHRPGGWFVKG